MDDSKPEYTVIGAKARVVQSLMSITVQFYIAVTLPGIVKKVEYYIHFMIILLHAKMNVQLQRLAPSTKCFSFSHYQSS
jgi:hypothetical protein